MKILVLNCGSSSLKYQLINMDNEQVLAKGLCDRIGIPDSSLTHKAPGHKDLKYDKPIKNHDEAVKLVFDVLTDKKYGVIKSLNEVDAIGHRVGHGGDKFTESVIVEEAEKNAIKDCIELAPLHNPANLMGIEACEKVAPGKKNVAVFDTAFGMNLSEKAYLYAIPYEYYKKYKIRKYGFHGTSHSFVSQAIIKEANLHKDTAKIVVCHLGNGGSVSASIGGKCVETSMGFTPVDGLIMGTRCGSIDPGVLQYICNKENKDINEIMDILNKKSGLLGLSNGLSNDFRDIREAAANGNELAAKTVETYRYRIALYIGQYVAAMNGVDAIAFTAGIGENDEDTRREVCSYLSYLGVEIDNEKNNNANGKKTLISSPDSKVKIYLYPTNEELAIARETLRLIK